MKLLTLNLHCMAEENIPEKQERITKAIIDNDIDVVFFQEVAQSLTSKKLNNMMREDNYGLTIIKKLRKQGLEYDYYFETTNLSFGSYEEGLMIISKYPLINRKCTFVSEMKDFSNWSVRKHLCADIKHNDTIITLSTVHLGWTEGIEVFENQVDLLIDNIDQNHLNILAGDFNVSSKSSSYEYLKGKNLYDLFALNGETDKHTPTHLKNMDTHKGETRIDYIFANNSVDVIDKKIFFNKNLVSDHYAVFLEIKFQ
ncbi:endonuclease/exonuclease/phosphatase family protein [Candidatus Izimaplasma bacterium]|nr:endonuclease/exonuclease/phosphatase family protein [Candidatus Izimaplasma bacterium]